MLFQLHIYCKKSVKKYYQVQYSTKIQTWKTHEKLTHSRRRFIVDRLSQDPRTTSRRHPSRLFSTRSSAAVAATWPRAWMEILFPMLWSSSCVWRSLLRKKHVYNVQTLRWTATCCSNNNYVRSLTLPFLWPQYFVVLNSQANILYI